MLGFAIAGYMLINLGIGLWASRFVKNTKDFVLAGQKLPLVLAASATFATWFGAESILGAPAEFLKHGVQGVIEDPFGAALCLFLVGLFFARHFYRLGILTFCDYFRHRYGKRAEIWSALLIVPSYISWIAAQLLAMGTVMKIVLGWPTAESMIVSTALVVTYTIWGGMWSISLTDFFQTILIIGGLAIVGGAMYVKTGGIAPLAKNMPDGFFDFFPKSNLMDWSKYIAAWITIGLGSIPQQDVFQRVMSARDAGTSVKACLLSAVMYLSVALIPLYIALCARFLYPDSQPDGQMMIPDMVMRHMSLPVQVLFLGALLSAILSTTSSAIMAPATVIGENIYRFFKPATTDRELLKVIRLGIVGIAFVAVIMASGRESIFELVAESSAFSLVTLFVPLTAGLYWKKATLSGCLLSMALGLGTWLSCVMMETDFPALLFGLTAAVLGMAAGSYASGFSEKDLRKNSREGL
ncbi:MAG: sodium:solute symporter [Cytophagaceae bacterium SCN 52-12]|nr:MAG: sodium:solute symporter [Cytophagaceae bacterium SCN 52-12]